MNRWAMGKGEYYTKKSRIIMRRLTIFFLKGEIEYEYHIDR